MRQTKQRVVYNYTQESSVDLDLRKMFYTIPPMARAEQSLDPEKMYTVVGIPAEKWQEIRDKGGGTIESVFFGDATFLPGTETILISLTKEQAVQVQAETSFYRKQEALKQAARPDTVLLTKVTAVGLGKELGANTVTVTVIEGKPKG